jgi:xanthine permease XanP
VAHKPSELVYGVEDKPPWGVLLLLAVQHIFLMSSTLLLPVILVTEIGGGLDQVRAVVAFTMIACGIGTILQAMRWHGIGSGFLCPNLCGPNFFAASVQSAWLGGLPLMRGMTIVAGLVEVVFARVVHRLEFLFPAEITGMVVLMVAVGLVPLGVSKFRHQLCRRADSKYESHSGGRYVAGNDGNQCLVQEQAQALQRIDWNGDWLLVIARHRTDEPDALCTKR